MEMTDDAVAKMLTSTWERVRDSAELEAQIMASVRESRALINQSVAMLGDGRHDYIKAFLIG